MTAPLVPGEFDVPERFAGPGFALEPLGAEHNERDFAAWMSSIDHIRATQGFPYGSWPLPMSLEENLADLVHHANDFADRTGFTYSVLDGDEVIGCVYIYPSSSLRHDASVRSWVRASRADLDVVLWDSMTTWLADEWPFSSVDYAPRV